MCERVQLPGGGFAIICGGHHRTKRPPCVNCGLRSTKLCDHVVADRGAGWKSVTCDAPICDRCALHVPGKNRDYCKRHAKHHLSEIPNPLPFQEIDTNG